MRSRSFIAVAKALIVLLAVVFAVSFLVGVGGAVAATPSARWSLRSFAYPSDFSAVRDNARCEAESSKVTNLECDTYIVTATNVGGKATSSGLVTLKDVLPAGLEVRHVSLFVSNKKPVKPKTTIAEQLSGDLGEQYCTPSPAQCVLPRPLQPDGSLKMYVSVLVTEPAPRTLTNEVSVSGGAAPEATASASNTVETGVPGFGASLFEAPFLGSDGLPETQAGGHPYELDTVLGLANAYREAPEAGFNTMSVEDVRDVVVDLPAGMAGSGVSAPRCTFTRLGSHGLPEEEGESRQGRSGCPDDTIVGHLRTFPEVNDAASSPIYNLLPDKGHAAELGFIDVTGGSHVLYVSIVPTPAGYMLRTTSKEIPQITLLEVIANVYGSPSTRPEDRAIEPAPPTFTNPSHCTGEPLATTVWMDSWQHPGSYNPDGTPNLSDPNWVSKQYESPPVSGCEQLQGLFEPSITASPSTPNADSPTGLDVNITVPQRTGSEELAVPPVRDTTVTLPAGVSVNPSSANGLQACSLEQVGISSSGLPDAAPPHCPDASKIGTVELETPALAMEACKQPATVLQECPNAGERENTPLTGSIYVARQDENPFGSLLAIYIVIDDPRTGVVVKIPAKVEADPNTGQLTTTVRDTPQFPFSELRTHFFDGSTAALKTPATCGEYTVSSVLTPWSAPESGPPATPSSAFEINHAASGGPCTAPGFNPSFLAGTETTKAGGYSPFSVTFARKDGEQGLDGTTVTMPPGVSAVLTGVPLCPEAQANQGACDQASLIGEATSAVGAGPEPYWAHGGKVYLTGPYAGGPFGLSIVVPTTAGPYTLTGNAGPGREVVRASIHVDPITAQVTATSDPLPQIIQGIPLDIKTVNVTINRTGFTFNPTNCNPMTATGTIVSTTGATIPVSSRFQASNCTSLGFKPQFKVSSNGKTSRKTGASLRTILAYPKAPFGSQTNIATVKVSLPRQLPSNLKTLQKACRHQTFEENPAACPNESRVGTATATTLLLPVPLTGPAYFVSYGGAKFPELVIVLQGYGITVDLHGETFIDEHTNVTTSTFHTVPDVPVGTFELNLPQGKNAALAAPTGLCGKKLVMPTTFTAQNGATIKQNTPIGVTNCPKAHIKHKAKHKAKKTKHEKKR